VELTRVLDKLRCSGEAICRRERTAIAFCARATGLISPGEVRSWVHPTVVWSSSQEDSKGGSNLLSCNAPAPRNARDSSKAVHHSQPERKNPFLSVLAGSNPRLSSPLVDVSYPVPNPACGANPPGSRRMDSTAVQVRALVKASSSAMLETVPELFTISTVPNELA